MNSFYRSDNTILNDFIESSKTLFAEMQKGFCNVSRFSRMLLAISQCSMPF